MHRNLATWESLHSCKASVGERVKRQDIKYRRQLEVESINGSRLLDQTFASLAQKGFDSLAQKGFDSLAHKGFDSLAHKQSHT